MKERLIYSVFCLLLMSGFLMCGWEYIFPQYTPWEINQGTVSMLNVKDVSPYSVLFMICGG